RLRHLKHAVSIEEIGIELLLIAMALDGESCFESLYGFLQDDVSRRRASIGLVIELCGASSSSAYVRSRLAPGAPLVDEYLILIEEPERPLLTRSLRVPDRVTAHLLGSDAPDPVVSSLSYTCEEAITEQTAPLVRWMKSAESPSRLAYIRERPGASGATLAASAFHQVGRRTLALH